MLLLALLYVARCWCLWLVLLVTFVLASQLQRAAAGDGRAVYKRLQGQQINMPQMIANDRC